VLVATDVASRGIDVDEISHVVNYDMPNTAEDYVHRIGRTARAGASGCAISFLDETEHEVLRDIEKILGVPLVCEDVDGFDYHPARIVPDPERAVLPKHGQPRRQGNGSGARNGGGGQPSGSRRSGRRGGRGRASQRYGSSSSSSSGGAQRQAG
jgi:ATP-dependent RNA helicase RhlE